MTGGGCVPIGIEGLLCATQHCAAICGMLPREVEVCVVPNAGWKMHLNFRLQSSIVYTDSLELHVSANCFPISASQTPSHHFEDWPDELAGQATCLRYESLGPETDVIEKHGCLFRKHFCQSLAGFAPISPAQCHELIQGSLHHMGTSFPLNQKTPDRSLYISASITKHAFANMTGNSRSYRERDACRKAAATGAEKQPASESNARSSTYDPMAVQMYLSDESRLEKTPYGRFCRGKWLLGSHGMKLMMMQAHSEHLRV